MIDPHKIGPCDECRRMRQLRPAGKMFTYVCKPCAMENPRLAARNKVAFEIGLLVPRIILGQYR
jgi:hypothetical protein